MHFRRTVILLVVLLLAIMPVSAQEDETTTVDFEEGSSIVLPAGWEVIFEPDAYGNITTSRSDGYSANMSFIPLASIGQAFDELGIDPDNAPQALLDFYLAQNDMSTDSGDLESLTLGGVDVLVFTMVDDEGSGRIYIGQFPNTQILLVTLGFDADVSLEDEAVQQVFADVQFIYENVTPAVADESGDMGDSNEDEEGRYRSSTGVSFVAPLEWELWDQDDSSSQYTVTFGNGMESITIEAPSKTYLEEGMASLGIDYDELSATVFQINRSSDFDEIEFDVESIVTTEFDGGFYDAYVIENDGVAQAMYLAVFEDNSVVLVRIYGDNATDSAYEDATVAIFESFEFGEMSEASEDDSGDDDSDISLLTLGDGTAFTVPDGWFIDNISNENRISMLIGDEDQAHIDLPSLADIAQGLEGLGVDLQGLPPVLIELQASSYEFEFDASAIEEVDVERGMLYTYSDVDDEGIYVAWYIMIYDDGHVGGVEYSSYDEIGAEMEEIALNLLNSVQFPE